MRRKLIFYNLIMIFLVISLVSLIVGLTYQKYLKNRIESEVVELQTLVSRSLQQQLSEVKNVLQVLSRSDEVQHYLNLSYADSRLEAESRVRNLLLEYSDIYPEYLNILICDADSENYLSNDSYRINRSGFMREQWYAEALMEPQRSHVYFHNSTRNLNSWRKYSSNSYLSISQAVYDPGRQTVKGVVLLDLSLQPFQQMYQDIDINNEGFLFLMNDEGQVVLSPQNEIVYRVVPAWFREQNQGIVRAAIAGRDYDVFYTRSDETGLIMVTVYDVGVLNALISQVRNKSLLIALSSFVIALIWSFLFVSSVTRPVDELTALMKRASAGDLSVRSSQQYSDEMASLADSFNIMVNKIDESQKLVLRVQQQKAEAEMQVLQEQIKPHFLYNTLDTISWMAKTYQAADIVALVHSLAEYYRVSLSKGQWMIPIAEEIKMVRAYLEIQNVRYEDMFSFEIDCPEELAEHQIVRMTLQPLVENAIYHGVKEADRLPCRIRIAVELPQPDMLRITVEDNGAGIDPETMRRIDHFLAYDVLEPGSTMYGIVNVHRRLRISQGEKSGLVFRAGTDGGTIVEVYCQS